MRRLTVLIFIVSFLLLVVVGCGGDEGQAEMQVLGFAERLTGTKYYADDLEVYETGHSVDEVFYVVRGTVLSGDDRRQSELAGQVEYLEEEDSWRLVELRIDGEYIFTE